MDLQDALQDFERQLLADGRAPATVGSYCRHARSFVRWLGQSGRPIGVREVHAEAVAAFMASPAVRLTAQGRPRQPASREAIRSSLKAMFGYLDRVGEVDLDPTRHLRPPRRIHHPPRILSDDEESRLREVLDRDGSPAGRWGRALFRLLLASGVRLGSAVGLDVSDVDLAGRELRLRTTKGSTTGAFASFPEDLVPLLTALIGSRRSGPLFVRPGGRPVTVRLAQRRFVRVREAAGLPPWVRCHSLRAAFADRLYRETGDIIGVQAALHHRSLATTARYLRLSGRASGPGVWTRKTDILSQAKVMDV